MKILTAAQMQRIDRLTTERYGVSSLTLMENAGRAVVGFLVERFAPLDRHPMVILCGGGNNGGDGFVVARLLRERGLRPRVIALMNPAKLKGDAAAMFEQLAQSGPPEVAMDIGAWQGLKPSLMRLASPNGPKGLNGPKGSNTVLVDALLGTGLSRPLEGLFLEVVRDVNTSFAGMSVVSVDLPSGISADSGELIGECVRAHASVTFTAPKIAHVFPPACEYAGEFVVKQIGTPPEALEGDAELFLDLTTREDLTWLVEPRRRDSHKGNFGHVLLIAGSVGKTGAAAMAAMAALRAGAGLVTIATPKSALPVVASLGMEFMTEPLPETDAGTISLRALDYGRLDKLVEGKSVLAAGPGIGSEPETAEFVRAVVQKYSLPQVLDADGLNAFAGCRDDRDYISAFRSPGIRVLTPHPGEMARLAGKTTADIQSHRLEVAREFATRYQVNLVLKGFRTLTAAPDGQLWVNPTGNPGMATGGTGDVLTGLIAGLLAQHSKRRTAEVVAAAAYLHGLAGDLAAREFGEISMVAGDLLKALPRAFKEVQSQKR